MQNAADTASIVTGVFPHLADQMGSNFIAIFAAVISLVSVLVTYFIAHDAAKSMRASEAAAQDRENELRTAARDRENELRTLDIYMQLEVHSSEVFKFTAEKADVIAPYRTDEKPARALFGGRSADGEETALNLYYQSLNLFEVCARMFRKRLFPDEVFASWISWFFEVLQSWFLREQWTPVIRSNYTTDVRAIFDVGCEMYADPDLPTDDARRAAFYQMVAIIMSEQPLTPEPSIANWIATLQQRRTWAELKAQVLSNLAGTNHLPPPAPRPPLRVA